MDTYIITRLLVFLVWPGRIKNVTVEIGRQLESKNESDSEICAGMFVFLALAVAPIVLIFEEGWMQGYALRDASGTCKTIMAG